MLYFVVYEKYVHFYFSCIDTFNKLPTYIVLTARDNYYLPCINYVSPTQKNTRTTIKAVKTITYVTMKPCC